MGVDVSVTCPVPAVVAWEVSTDLALWPEWGPSVTAVDPPAGSVHAGMTGRVRTPFGVWLPFTVDDVDPGVRWTWHIGPVPATGHRVDRVDDDSCRLVIEVPLWAAAYGLVCHVALTRLSALVVAHHEGAGDG